MPTRGIYPFSGDFFGPEKDERIFYNAGPGGEPTSRNAGLRGRKTTFCDAGLRSGETFYDFYHFERFLLIKRDF